jgi:hypothetical protein
LRNALRLDAHVRCCDQLFISVYRNFHCDLLKHKSALPLALRQISGSASRTLGVQGQPDIARLRSEQNSFQQRKTAQMRTRRKG